MSRSPIKCLDSTKISTSIKSQRKIHLTNDKPSELFADFSADSTLPYMNFEHSFEKLSLVEELIYKG